MSLLDIQPQPELLSVAAGMFLATNVSQPARRYANTIVKSLSDMEMKVDWNIRYTPERDCKYFGEKVGEKDCVLKSKHRNLNRCKICLYGKRR